MIMIPDLWVELVKVLPGIDMITGTGAKAEQIFENS